MNDLYVTFDWVDSTLTKNKQLTNFIPVRIIFNDKTTICYFEDESKTVVTCSNDDEYTEEAGVAACIAKRVFNSRSAFLKAVEKGYRQPFKDKVEKKWGIDFSSRKSEIMYSSSDIDKLTETFKQAFNQFRYF